MRTSRITRDAVRALKSSPSRGRKNSQDAIVSEPATKSLRNFQYRLNEDSSPASLKHEDSAITQNGFPSAGHVPENAESINERINAVPSRKRKRNEGTLLVESTNTTSSQTKSVTNLSAAATETRTVKEEVISPSKPLPRKPRRAPAKRALSPSGDVKIDPPSNWEQMYNLIKEMRSRVLAPVDTVGCERLSDTQAPPKDQRFQTLVALMLSSQTKDTVTAVAMQRLKEELPGGLNVQAVRSAAPETFNELIGKVGFHNTKTKNIIAAAEILARDYDSDIPSTITGLTSLPGVGPKMAYLTMSAAWGRTEGIGVDVHVHRITNLWGWHQTRSPEETRAILEAWLPKEKWHEINTLLVGLGQTICTPVARKCGDCVLGQRGLCPGAVREKVKKAKVEKEVVEADGKKVKMQGVEVESVENGTVRRKADVSSNIQPLDIEDFGRQSRRRSGRLKGS